MAVKRMPRTARASLVDRLVDELPNVQQEVRPLRTLTRAEYRESILRDLLWLLNCRTSHPADRFDGRDLTVIDYGIPDFGAYSPASSDDRNLLARRMARAITAFEPRLRNVRVRIEPAMVNERTLKVHIDAVLLVETLREPVSFRTVFQTSTGTWEIHENRP